VIYGLGIATTVTYAPWTCAPMALQHLYARRAAAHAHCLAGAAAIRATAHPDKTDAIYFVASAKGDGSHVFSSTLQQHNAAVASYLAHQRHKAAGDRVR